MSAALYPLLALVIGSATTLAGVWLANRNHDQRLKAQLQHDSSQRERDRLAAMRKDVYLLAPREAAKAIAYISELPNRDLATIGQDEGIKGFAAVAAQISVLADIETTATVNALGMAFTSQLMDALRDLHMVQDTRSDIEIKNKRLGEVFDEISRIQAERQRLSESGVVDVVRNESLGWWMTQRMGESDDLRKELQDLRVKHQRHLLEYQKIALQRLPDLMGCHTRFLSAMRKELGLWHDMQLFERQFQQQGEELREKLVRLTEGWAAMLETAPEGAGAGAGSKADGST